MRHRHDNLAGNTDRLRQRAAGAAIGVGWAAAIAFGMARLSNYSVTPGQAATIAPAGAALVAAGRPSLVMFLHPFCPCSVASVDALATLAASAPDAAVTVVFSDVTDEGRTAADGGLWRRVGEIGNARRAIDRDGTLARRFDAHTSGQLFAYGADGVAGYRGGVTAGRGERGDNLGLQAARAALAGRAPTTRSADVFGCELN